MNSCCDLWSGFFFLVLFWSPPLAPPPDGAGGVRGSESPAARIGPSETASPNSVVAVSTPRRRALRVIMVSSNRWAIHPSYGGTRRLHRRCASVHATVITKVPFRQCPVG